MATNFRAKLANQPSFGTLAFRNGLEYRNTDFKTLNGNIMDTSCANAMTIGPVTPEITRVEIVTLGTMWQKLTYPTECLRKY